MEKLVTLGFALSTSLTLLGTALIANLHLVGYFTTVESLAGMMQFLKTSTDLTSAGFVVLGFGLVTLAVSLVALLIAERS